MLDAPIAFGNGHFIAAEQLVLPAHDAGFVFGATITDFCRTFQGKLFHWHKHLARFLRDCHECRIPVSFSLEELAHAGETLIQQNAKLLPDLGELALITFATPGPLGYMIGLPENGPPTLGMHTFPLPVARYAKFQEAGAILEAVGVTAGCQSSIVPVPVKHRSRMNWWLAQRTCVIPGAVPVLLNAETGSPDAAIGSELEVKDGVVIRPPADAILDSISLQIAEKHCEKLGIAFREESLNFRDFGQLAGISELLLVGSGFGIAGVKCWVQDEREHALAWPGPVLQRLQPIWFLAQC